MGKVFSDDKLRIQTLREQGLIYRAIAAKYAEKNWKLVWKMGADTLNMSWNKLFLQGFELLASCDSLKCQISMFRLISIQAL